MAQGYLLVLLIYLYCLSQVPLAEGTAELYVCVFRGLRKACGVLSAGDMEDNIEKIMQPAHKTENTHQQEA